MTKVLSAERLRELLHYDPDTGVFTWRIRRRNGIRVGDTAGGADGRGYCRIHMMANTADHIGWHGYGMTGEWPVGEIDHRNLDRADNRWANLRGAAKWQNHANTSLLASNTSGFKGVNWCTAVRRWESRIRVDGRRVHLGYFPSPELAHAAYCGAAMPRRICAFRVT